MSATNSSLPENSRADIVNYQYRHQEVKLLHSTLYVIRRENSRSKKKHSWSVTGNVPAESGNLTKLVGPELEYNAIIRVGRSENNRKNGIPRCAGCYTYCCTVLSSNFKCSVAILQAMILQHVNMCPTTSSLSTPLSNTGHHLRSLSVFDKIMAVRGWAC